MLLPPLPDQPPIINGTWAAYIGVVATILIGIFFTKDDKRNFENILSNLVSFFLLLATIQFTWLILLFMGLYLIMGLGVALQKMRKWFFLFGSKTYGSLALVLLLVYDKRLSLGIELSKIDFPVTTVVAQDMMYLIFYWFVLALAAHIVGFLYWRKTSPTKVKGKASDLKARLAALFVSKEKKGRSRRGRRKEKSSRRK